MLGLEPFSPAAVLQKRFARKSTHVVATAEVSRALRLLGCASKMKPSLCSAALKTIVDGWCTPGNFGNTVGSCPFCGSEENDKLEHFATCAGVGEAVRFAWRIDMPSLDRHLVPYSADDDCWAVKHMFCLASVYNSCRHGRQFSKQAYKSFRLSLAICIDSPVQ